MQILGSKNISAIDFEASDDDSGTLLTTFVNGRTYAYSDVPRGVYDALVTEAGTSGGSVGKAFSRLVKSVGFDYEER